MENNKFTLDGEFDWVIRNKDKDKNNNVLMIK